MASVRLEAQPKSVREARQFVRRALGEADVESPDSLLLTSELVSNVISHARTEFELVVEVRDAALDPDADATGRQPRVVRIEIHDGLAVTDAFRELIEHPPTQVAVGEIGGRGLLLLGAISARFGLIDKGSSGKVVWFESTPEND